MPSGEDTSPQAGNESPNMLLRLFRKENELNVLPVPAAPVSQTCCQLARQRFLELLLVLSPWEKVSLAFVSPELFLADFVCTFPFHSTQHLMIGVGLG